jgi:hypothetical protein
VRDTTTSDRSERMEITSTALFGMCGRCYDDNLKLFPANCAEKPELPAGQPLGMYHCPDCGAMVVAGVPHPPMCERCIARQHPGFDMPNATGERPETRSERTQ